MEEIFKGNSELTITKFSVGRESRIVPFAIEAEVKNGSDLADIILNSSKFKELKEKVISNNSIENGQSQLISDIKDSKLKITIKIELEKYE